MTGFVEPIVIYLILLVGIWPVAVTQYFLYELRDDSISNDACMDLVYDNGSVLWFNFALGTTWYFPQFVLVYVEEDTKRY